MHPPPPPNTLSTKGDVMPEVRREYARLLHLQIRSEERYRKATWDRAVCVAAGVILGFTFAIAIAIGVMAR